MGFDPINEFLRDERYGRRLPHVLYPSWSRHPKTYDRLESRRLDSSRRMKSKIDALDILAIE